MTNSGAPLASVESLHLACIEGESLFPEDEESAIYALILRVDPATRITALGVVNEMPPEDLAVVGGVLAAAAKARSGRVAIDSLQFAYELLSRTDGTPEQRRMALQVIKGGR